ncbi:MAG: CDP-alcohol phosphatidyltransferase family protein [Nitrospirota bacterium]|nr:CDP-alcohol phosphatidyltransferase family protein [Nitrospirota bacterium]
MVANLITLARVILVFVVIALLGQDFYLDILMIAMTGFILALDAVDGYVARKRKETSDFGALFDIVGDRVVENIYWIYFAVVGLIPFWLPMIVLARGFVTDGIRSAAFAQGKSAFGEKTMMRSPWTRMLTSSRASRGIYGISKTVAFLYLGGVIALKSAAATYNILPEFIASFEVAGMVIATLTVSMCIVRGIPVLVNGWEYVKG